MTRRIVLFCVFMSYFVLAFFVSCSDSDEVSPEPGACSTPATVVDLTGLDGCGFVFELEDGTTLLPVVFFCSTPPLPENSLAGFEYVDGKKVLIDYELTGTHAGACMAGEYAFIKCITEVKPAPSTNEQ